MKIDKTLLMSQSNLFNAINITLEELSVYDEGAFENIMASVTEKLAKAAGVDNITLMRCSGFGWDVPLAQVLRWDGKNRRLEGSDFNVHAGVKCVSALTQRLLKNECVSVCYSEADEDMQEYMFQLGVMSMLIVPVFISGELWGEISFEYNKEECKFETVTVNLLRQASAILVNAYIRAETERKLRHSSDSYRSLVDDLMRRDKMLSTLNQTAVTFLSNHGRIYGKQLYYGLQMIAGYADIDRVCVWKREETHGMVRYTLYRKWSGTDDTAVYPKAIEEGSIFPFEAFTDWDGIFRQEGYIHCLTSELNPQKQSVLNGLGTDTLLIFPVFSGEGLWGLVSFENCKCEKLFKPDEVDTLHYATLVLGSVIVRDEETERVREAESRIKLMLDATPLSCQLWDRSLNFIDCNEAAYKLFNLSSRDELKGTFPSFVPEFQPNGRKSLTYGKENLIKAFAEGGAVFEWLFVLPDGSSLPAEVTLKRVEHKGGYIVAGYMRDLRMIRLLESEAGKIYLDPLTGIYNRRFLDENLVRNMKSLSRSGGMLSLMIIDVDRFKEYNDTYGHTEGDRCLRGVAETLKNGVTRADDYVARYGGEEFAVVLPNTDENGARLIADRLRRSVRELRLRHKRSDVDDFVTISVGATSGRVTPRCDAQSFIDCADNMLYKAKYEGRNRYCYQGI